MTQINPMMERLSQVNTNNVTNNIAQLKQAYSRLSGAGSQSIYNSMVQNIIAQNPVLKPYVQKYGMNFMQAFQDEAKSRGVNPNDILRLLKS